MNANHALGVSRHEASLFRESASLGCGPSPGVGTEASLALTQQEALPPTLAPSDPSLAPRMAAPTAQTTPAPNWPQYTTNPASTANYGTQRGPTTAPVLRSYSMPAAPSYPIPNTGRVAASPSLAIHTPTSAQQYYALSPQAAHQLPPPAPPMMTPVQRQAQSLPNVFSGMPPPMPSTATYPPTTNTGHVYTSPPPMNRNMPPPPHHQAPAPAPAAFVPAGPPAFTMATPYGTAPMSTSTSPRPHAGYGMPTSAGSQATSQYVNMSPRKVPPPGSAVALEAGGDSQATLVDADGAATKAGAAAPWYAKIGKAVTSISKVWSGPEQQQQPNQHPYPQQAKYTATSYYPAYPQQNTPQYGSGYPPTTPAAYLGMPPAPPGPGSPHQQHQHQHQHQMSISIHSPHQHQQQHLHGHAHYSTAAHQGQHGSGNANGNGVGLVKQPVPGMGTYHGFSKVHPGLRHHQGQGQQAQPQPQPQPQVGYGVRMDGPVV